MRRIATPARAPRRRALRRGQAMLEYSLLNWVLVIALILACTVRVIPGPPDAGDSGRWKNVIEMFLEAYQIYYDSYYFVLNMPFP